MRRRLEDDVRPPLLPERDQQLEDVLAAIGERAHVEVVHGQVRLGDAELGGRLAHLARERVGREARAAATASRSRTRRSGPRSPPRRAAPSCRRSRTRRRRCAARARALACQASIIRGCISRYQSRAPARDTLSSRAAARRSQHSRVGARMAQLAAVLGALGAPLLLVPGRDALSSSAGSRLIAARRGGCSRVSGPSGVSPAPRRARASSGSRSSASSRRASCAGRRSSRSRARRRAVPAAARLRRGAPLLRRRSPHGGAARPAAAALRRARARRARARLAARARRARQCDAAPARDRVSPSAAFVAFASLSLLWSSDGRRRRRTCSQFFLLPFAVLVAVVGRAPFPAWMPRALGVDRRRARRRSSRSSASSRRRRTG